MNAKQLRDIVDTSHINSHKTLKESIRRRLETAAHNGLYEITFDPQSYDGPFLLPEAARKTFLEELTNDGFVVSCDTRSKFWGIGVWWNTKTITISWA